VYVCADDNGDIKHVPVDLMRRLVLERPGFIRNLTPAGLETPYTRFPAECDGGLPGTVLCRGIHEGVELFRVIGKRGGKWYLDDVDAEALTIRVRSGVISDTSMRVSARGRRVVCEVPDNPGAFLSSDSPVLGVQTDVTLLYVTDAVDEYSHRLRYAGMEFSGGEVEKFLPGLNDRSLLLREAYRSAFGRDDDALLLQHIPGKIFVVLPYTYAEKLLVSGKRPVRISRVIVSALAFRGGAVFGESRVVLSGVLGSGEVRGSGGSLDSAVRELADELKQTFKMHVQLRSKHRARQA
jgi:hypothetical protein